MRPFALRPAGLRSLAATLVVSGMACTGVIGGATSSGTGGTGNNPGTGTTTGTGSTIGSGTGGSAGGAGSTTGTGGGAAGTGSPPADDAVARAGGGENGALDTGPAPHTR